MLLPSQEITPTPSSHLLHHDFNMLLNVTFPYPYKYHVLTRNSIVNVIDLTNRFITWVEAPFLDAVFSWIFSAWPDGFDGRDEQVEQFV